MKLPALLLASLTLAAAASGQPAPKTTPAPKSPEQVAPGAPKKEAPKIEGIAIPRGEGFLGIQIVDSGFRLSFYDKKKTLVEPDVDRAALRWDPKYKVGGERLVLIPSADRKSLSSPKAIRPPYNFKLFITLIKDAAEGSPAVNETFVVDFKQ